MANYPANGLIASVFTPLTDNYVVNIEAIRSYGEYLENNGITSVLVGGTAAEPTSLSLIDRKKVINEWIKFKHLEGFYVMVQVGGVPLPDVVELVKYCEMVGVDSILTLPELYFKPQDVTDLVTYVELVAKAAPNLPVLYYHNPSMSKVEVNMPDFVTAATARIRNFKGLNFASNNLAEAAQVLRNLNENQFIFMGDETLVVPAAALGIKKSIGTILNIFPRLVQEILNAVQQNDTEDANFFQEILSLALEAITLEGSLVDAMKFVMTLVSGINIGPSSRTQKHLSVEAKNRIIGKLKFLDLIS